MEEKFDKPEDMKLEMKNPFETDANETIAPLLKRVSLFLEDKDWVKADEYCERVLDQDPENATAYLGKLMVEMKVSKLEELVDCAQSFESSNNYQKAVRFGGDKIAFVLNGYNARIRERNNNTRIVEIYNEAMSVMKSANSEEAFRAAAEGFKKIPGFNDADILAEQCLAQAEEYHEKKRVEKEKKNKNRKKATTIILSILAICIVVVVLLILVILPAVKKSSFIKNHGQSTYDLFGLVEAGKTITFGSYEQDNNNSNGKEPIEWIVLEVTDNKALVISRYVLDNRPFNDTTPKSSLGGRRDPACTWEKCDLREWLNSVFLKETFNHDVQNAILETKLSSKLHDWDGTSIKETRDKVFLLNTEEVEAYFETEENRQAYGTAYSYSSAVSVSNGGICCWWLRDTVALDAAKDVRLIGDFNSSRVSDMEGIRPAMWISLKGDSSNQIDNDLTELESYPPVVPEITQEETETKTPDESQVLYSTGDELMFRTGPGTEFTAISKLNIGDSLILIEEQNGWAHGTVGGVEGWASMEFLTSLKPEYIEAIRKFDYFPTAIANGIGCKPVYRGEDDTYIYVQVYSGGGWECVKVTKTSPYTVQYMSNSEKSQYEENPYANTGNLPTQEEVVLAWVCEYNQMTADQFYEAGGHIDYQTSGTNYDYYIVAPPMAAATIVEITKTPPYTIDRTGSSYAFTGPGGWGYR